MASRSLLLVFFAFVKVIVKSLLRFFAVVIVAEEYSENDGLPDDFFEVILANEDEVIHGCYPFCDSITLLRHLGN